MALHRFVLLAPENYRSGATLSEGMEQQLESWVNILLKRPEFHLSLKKKTFFMAESKLLRRTRRSTAPSPTISSDRKEVLIVSTAYFVSIR